VEVKGGRGVTIWHLCFNEDLLQVVNANNTLLLDVGWYPDSDPSGEYRLQVIRVYDEGKKGRDSYDWRNPVVDFFTRSLQDLLVEVHKIVSGEKEVRSSVSVTPPILCPRCSGVLQMWVKG